MNISAFAEQPMAPKWVEKALGQACKVSDFEMHTQTSSSKTFPFLVVQEMRGENPYVLATADLIAAAV